MSLTIIPSWCRDALHRGRFGRLSDRFDHSLISLLAILMAPFGIAIGSANATPLPPVSRQANTTLDQETPSSVELVPSPAQPAEALSRATALPQSLSWELVVEENEENEPNNDDQASRPSGPPVWTLVSDDLATADLPEDAAELDPTTLPAVPPPPVPEPLFAFGRSVAFGHMSVGPDLGIRVPNGLQWSPENSFDASIRGFSRTGEPGTGDFFNWNGGDAVAQFELNLLRIGRFSFGLNHSIRSVYSGDLPGGSSDFGEGQSSGFRLAYALSDTSGIALGGEQIIQWDDQTDTGRTFYLMATKGWWLGKQGRDFPLFIANGGIATGRLASDKSIRFWCTAYDYNRPLTFSIDNELCWAPTGSLALLFSPQFGLLAEYNSINVSVGFSVAPIKELPLRLTWAVGVVNDIHEYGWAYDADRLNWNFRISLGF